MVCERDVDEARHEVLPRGVRAAEDHRERARGEAIASEAGCHRVRAVEDVREGIGAICRGGGLALEAPESVMYTPALTTPVTVPEIP